MVEWHTYKEEFKKLKKTASIVITRNAESFDSLNNVYDTSLNAPKVIKIDKPEPKKELQAEQIDIDALKESTIDKEVTEQSLEEKRDNELEQLRNLDIPDANTNFTADFNDSEVYLPPKPIYQQKKQIQPEEEEHLAEDVMSNLSQFVNRNR